MKKILCFFVLPALLFTSCTSTYHTTVVAPPPQQPQAPPPVTVVQQAPPQSPPPVTVIQQPPQAPPPVAIVQQAPAPAQEENSYQVFYNELGAYGRWIDYPNEGYVWSPNVAPDFQPYSTNGHWVYTDQGWTWVSDYPWGWAAFHYGRWFYEDGYGWLWLPGHEWAPAWVKWGQSGNYYGWAPLAPHITAEQQWTPPQRAWTFVPAEHINKPNVQQYVVNKVQKTTIIQNVTIINNTTTVVNNNVTNNINNSHINNTTNVNNTHINNTTNNNTTNNNINNTHVTNVTNNNIKNNTTIINKGPQVTEVEKVANIHVQKVNIVENNKPAQTHEVNNNVVMYRPTLKPEAVQKNGMKPAPMKVEAYHKPLTKPQVNKP